MAVLAVSHAGDPVIGRLYKFETCEQAEQALGVHDPYFASFKTFGEFYTYDDCRIFLRRFKVPNHRWPHSDMRLPDFTFDALLEHAKEPPKGFKPPEPEPPKPERKKTMASTRINREAVIRFNPDYEGRDRRPGSKAAHVASFMKDGQTVQEFLDLVKDEGGDISWVRDDLKAGRITLEQPEG